MTTPLNDDDRLVDAVAEAWCQNKSDEARRWAKMHLHALTKAGITLTPPPAPEPVYTIRLTKSQLTTLLNGWHSINQIHTWTENERELFHMFRNATPEER